MKDLSLKNKKGFTLIEVMIATALFTVIMVVGIGAVLGANDAHKRTQNIRATLDNLSFVMEEMSRSLRTGTRYHCNISSGILTDPQDCPNDYTRSIAFESVNGDPTSAFDQWVYSIQPSLSNPAHIEVVKKYEYPTGSGNQITVPLTPLNVEIDPIKSGFTVTGSCPVKPVGGLCTDLTQPKVVIRLSGQVLYKGQGVPFDLQTTVSQRVLDY